VKERKLTDWAKGPPPCEGWWNASLVRDEKIRRWWDGRQWSWAACVGDSDAKTASMKIIKAAADVSRKLEWRGLAEKPQ
jgi:hypothetical protein